MKIMMIAALVLALWSPPRLGCQPLSITRVNHEWRAGCFEQDDGGRQVNQAGSVFKGIVPLHQPTFSSSILSVRVLHRHRIPA